MHALWIFCFVLKFWGRMPIVHLEDGREAILTTSEISILPDRTYLDTNKILLRGMHVRILLSYSISKEKLVWKKGKGPLRCSRFIHSSVTKKSGRTFLLDRNGLYDVIMRIDGRTLGIEWATSKEEEVTLCGIYQFSSRTFSSKKEVFIKSVPDRMVFSRLSNQRGSLGIEMGINECKPTDICGKLWQSVR